MNKIRILIVDDHPIMRDSICALLRQQGDVEVAGEASDGREAIQKARELAPDVILMDLMMPGLDGLRAISRLKKANPAVKVLVLTQYETRQHILSAINAGAVGYIPKKALSSELRTAIRTVHAGGFYLYPSATEVLMANNHQQGKEESYECLTGREREILELIARGHTHQEIGDMLDISSKTVQSHRSKISRKLGLRNRAELVKSAIKHGLVSMDK